MLPNGCLNLDYICLKIKLKLKSVIPNTLTSINLFCGCIAVLSFLNESYLLGVTLVFIAAIADFFDGFVARLLKVQSDLGKELDSLADMVSFGFVPGAILYVAFQKVIGIERFNNLIETQTYLPFLGFLVTVFSGLRLAKFNIDSRQSTSFIGLPTPANTLFFLTLPLIWLYGEENHLAMEISNNLYVLITLTLVFSYLLVAELPLIALKFKGFELKQNILRYTLILLGILSIILFGYLCIPVILITYISISIMDSMTKKSEKN